MDPRRNRPLYSFILPILSLVSLTFFTLLLLISCSTPTFVKPGPREFGKYTHADLKLPALGNWQKNEFMSTKKNNELSSLSNKQIYFLELYRQFELLKKESSLTSLDLNACPYFHSLLLEKKKLFHSDHVSPKTTPSVSLVLSNPEFMPEYFLPLSHKKNGTTVYQWEKVKRKPALPFLTQALKLHTEKIYYELQELCEYGVGQHFFLFENLGRMTHQKPWTASDQSLHALLKISIFYNEYILTSLSSWQDPAATSMQEVPLTAQEALHRVNSVWFRNFLAAFGQKKTSLAYGRKE